MRHAESAGIPRDTPWYKLTPEQKHWVIDGTPGYRRATGTSSGTASSASSNTSRARPTRCTSACCLSKYRSYTPCESCGGARLKTEGLLWRLGSKDDADAVHGPGQRFLPVGIAWSREQLRRCPGCRCTT